MNWMNVILKAVNSVCWAALVYSLLQAALSVSTHYTTLPEGVDFDSMIRGFTFLVFLIAASTYKIDAKEVKEEKETTLDEIEKNLKG